NMNGRLYDPLIGRFLSPDPFVPDATFTQDFNRYMYARNNPLSYIDPTGEIVWFVPIIIGAVVGGVSGGIIAHNNGGEWWQGALIGAGIGALSGGTAVGVSALGGGAMLAGASAGAVGGAGFSGLATDWNGEAMLRGATFGAISGFVGGGFASAIGGGWGALAGGASANLTNQLLYNGGDFSQVNWASVGFGAGLSFGMYHGMQYWQYKAMGGRLGPMDITYRQFARMNTAYQRSRFWQREYGVVFNRDGSARLVRGNRYDVTMVVRPRDGEFATAHTHWARAGRDVVVNGQPFTTVGGYHSPQDLKIPGFSVVIGRTTSTYSIGTGVSHFIRPDPFIRFHLFPFLSLRR
ncbi:MAG: hypothetical protein FWC98_00555, partial [Bacteroidales bacterium]|nr:hypothetical protein [Bacteroidales bacterium]